MCLYTKQICPLRARKNIMCYKVFTPSRDPRFIRTLCMYHAIVKPTKGHPTLMDDTDTPLRISHYGFYRPVRHRISKGMIHAFRTKAIANNRPFNLPKKWIYKCIIPKGTLYYIGVNGDICAKKMLVIEELNPNTAG